PGPSLRLRVLRVLALTRTAGALRVLLVDGAQLPEAQRAGVLRRRCVSDRRRADRGRAIIDDQAHAERWNRIPRSQGAAHARRPEPAPGRARMAVRDQADGRAVLLRERDSGAGRLTGSARWKWTI